MVERYEAFTVLITKINRSIRRIKNQEMAKYNLRNSHVSCLYYLYIGKDLTATDLCERCEEDKATISRALDYLETNGYIAQRSKSEKRYKTPLVLTEKGRVAGKRIAQKIEQLFIEVSKDVCETEREALYRNLSAISKGLERRLKAEEDSID